MREKERNIKYQNEEIKKQTLMKGKNKNTKKNDLYDLKKEESDNEKNIKTKIKTMIDSNGKKTSYYIKSFGEKYKSKKGKRDKIIHGKYETFACIQLNPKSFKNKGKRGNAKIWADLMKNDNK